MTELTAENVERLFSDSLFREGEPVGDAVTADAIIFTVGFNPQRLESHKIEIGEMLSQLPEAFQASKGQGCSFLNACVTANGTHWGEHRSIGMLLALGTAAKQAEILFPRSMWPILPGGMPYFSVSPTLGPVNASSGTERTP